jgi:DTW domain-containing protein
MNPSFDVQAPHVHCVQCWSPMPHCICPHACEIPNRLPVQVFIHHKELSRRSNSTHLLRLLLKQVSFEVHGAPNQPTQWPDPSLDERLCVLFPSDEAQPLSAGDAASFDRLIIVDGNWRQAKKASNRLKQIVNPSFRTIPFNAPSEFKLRTQSAEERLSSFEATARALSILESPSYWDQMMPIFRAHVEVTMEQRSRRGAPRQKNLR